MKKIYVNEKWCLGCHLCEYFCVYANSGISDMTEAIKNKPFVPRVNVACAENSTFAVNCRQCENPICVSACISGALSKNDDGIITVDKSKCVGCGSCVMVCPFGAISIDGNGVANKCELCFSNSFGSPLCVTHCPNNAIVFEER